MSILCRQISFIVFHTIHLDLRGHPYFFPNIHLIYCGQKQDRLVKCSLTVVENTAGNKLGINLPQVIKPTFLYDIEQFALDKVTKMQF